MLTAILVMLMLWCLFYGHISFVLLGFLCLGFGVLFLLIGKHKHTGHFTIDAHAQVSRLNKVNATLKFWVVLVLLALCVSAQSPIVGLLLALIMSLLIICAGGLKTHAYVHLMMMPVSFLLLSGLALLFEVTRQQTGVIHLPLFGYWLCVRSASQIQTALVMSRALGAVSCLYLLSLTTPMSELIGVLRRVRCPDVLISLMFLIYRYIFILFSLYETMKAATDSRMGSINYRIKVRTAGRIYSNLLTRSYQQASQSFDAMESRCFNTEIRFLETKQKITVIHAATASGIMIFTVSLSLWLR